MRVDASRDESLYLQIYEGIREEILRGRLRPGQKLPATRRLARQFAVSRPTVVLAFEMLLAEGYVQGRVGSGTFVSRELPDDLLQMRPPVPARTGSKEETPRIAERTRRTEAPVPPVHSVAARPFRMGLPAIESLPFGIWARIASRLVSSPANLTWDYGDPAGDPALRKSIAEHLLQSRGVECTFEQVLITCGSQQALDLTARVLLDPGEKCWVEDPGYPGARAALSAAGARLVPVPVDENGLSVERGRELAPDARLVTITPSHQYPLGVAMCLTRRLELLEWARETDAWVLEDDYDSEFRYVGKPLAPLKQLDSGSRVVYVGTFSKVLFPALRIGYLVVPETLVDSFLAVQYASSRQAPTFEQAVLARFMEEGHLVRHIRRMRVLYNERQEVLREAVAAEMGGVLTVEFAPTGMHVVARLDESMQDRAASALAADVGVVATPLSSLRMASLGPPALLLGYAGFDNEQIRSAVRKLGKAFAKVSSATTRSR